MNARQLFHDHLLLGKTVTISFPNRKALLTFRSELQTAKRRLEESSAKFGFETGTETQSICTQQVADTAPSDLTYKVWLGTKPTKPNLYTILNITDGTEPE